MNFPITFETLYPFLCSLKLHICL